MPAIKDIHLMETKLLRILDTILTEKNITKAARSLRISQPATSAALRKIRDTLGDPLVISDGKTLILTERAASIHITLKKILSDIESIVSNKSVFDPSVSDELFKIASPDNVAHYLFSNLYGNLYSKSPNLKIEINSFTQNFDPFTSLKDGVVDVVIGNWAELPDNVHYSHLYDDRMVCLMRKNHPYANGITKKQYLEAQHIAPTQYSVGKRGVVDIYLSRHRLKRNVVATMPFFNLTPYALINTDLIFTVNESLANFFSEKLDLAVVEPPLPFPKVSYTQLWHERTHYSPANIWLRKQISIAAQTQVS